MRIHSAIIILLHFSIFFAKIIRRLDHLLLITKRTVYSQYAVCICVDPRITTSIRKSLQSTSDTQRQ